MFLLAPILAIQDGWASLGLTAPTAIRANDWYIDTEHGHAHPLYTDWDGDGKPDLIVGQFEGGKAKIYLNSGSTQAPKFTDFSWFQAGAGEGKVPFG